MISSSLQNEGDVIMLSKANHHINTSQCLESVAVATETANRKGCLYLYRCNISTIHASLHGMLVHKPHAGAHG